MCDRQLKEQFINRVNDEMRATEIMKEPTIVQKISNITHEKCSAGQKAEAQQVHKALLKMTIKREERLLHDQAYVAILQKLKHEQFTKNHQEKMLVLQHGT